MDVPEPLRKAIKELKKHANRADEVGQIANSVLPLLDQTRSEIESGGDMQVVPARTSQRAKSQITYVVETTAAGDTLAERRESGTAQPFRCPKSIYEAMAGILAAAKTPLALDEIVAAVEEKIRDRPADHQVRVPLRLWLHMHPALIVRHRARYTAASPSSFATEVRKLWNRLMVG